LLPAFAGFLQTEIDGRAAYDAFLAWQKTDAAQELDWDQKLKKYGARLRAEGLSDEAVRKTLSVISARDEAVLYNPAFEKKPTFSTRPSRLLVEAVEKRAPGRALDVGMGQGRNAIYLAQKGWEVTGFDVAEVGLRKAREQAARMKLELRTEHVSDEEFDFGTNRWDLIAIILAIEKRSVYKVRQALKPGGLVVIEAGHKDVSGAPFEFDSNELLEVFKGFRILKYEDTVAMHDWVQKPKRLVRLIARKPD
jgi:SAM-dependent methyltransferase